MSDLTPKSFFGSIFRLITAKPAIPPSLEGNTHLKTILERRSVRKFKPDPIGPDHWAAILEAGRVAPSTVNLQTWSFAEFTAPQWREFFGQPLPFEAARGIVILADTHRMNRAVPALPRAPLCEYTIGVMNASLAAMNMTCAAEALGIASVMLSETGRTGFYDAAHLKTKLELPDGVVPIMSIVFGWPDVGAQAMPPKLPLEAVTFTGAYKETPAAMLDAWYDQMQAGYLVSQKGQSFESKIKYYARRIDDAERDLWGMVLPE